MSLTSTAVMNLDLPGPTISRHIYGHFAEHLGRCIYEGFWVGEDSEVDNIHGIRADVVEALRQLQIPNLRWPGGCFADEYHWLDGVGPRQDRPRMVNTHWGDVVEDNSFGTHEFMQLCELLGTEPYISANVGSGTVRETSEWVEYLTRGGDAPMSGLRHQHGRKDPWNVRFLGIGNEPWGCGGFMTADHYMSIARQHATYARDHGDNRLWRIAAGASDDNYAWTETIMKHLTTGLGDPDPSDVFQAVSFHYYTYTGTWSDKGSATEFTRQEHAKAIQNAKDVRRIIAGHAAVMDAYDPSRKVGLVLDEWGTWWNVEPDTNPGFLYQQNTMRDALVAAVHFHAFHDFAERLRMANIAQTVNVLQAMILTDGPQMVLTPTYHVFEMSTGHHDAQRLDVQWSDVQWSSAPEDTESTPTENDDVLLSASIKEDKLTITAANLNPDAARTIRLDLRGAGVDQVSARVLVGHDVRSHNTAEHPDAVRPEPHDQIHLDHTPNAHGTSAQILTVELPAGSFVSVDATVI